MKKIALMAAVLLAAATVKAANPYEYDHDFDGVDDYFDECPDQYAYTLTGCPGGPPDNREQSCENPIKVKPGLYVKDNVLVIPLNRKFCWSDQSALLMLEEDGVLYIATIRQRVPGVEELWNTTFTVDGHEMKVRAKGMKTGKKVVHSMAITGFKRPVVSWDLSKARIVVAEEARKLPYSEQPTAQWRGAVSGSAIEEFARPQRHRFDVIGVEVVDSDDGSQVGVRVTTTLTELLTPADTRVGAPDISVKLGHYFLYWRAADWTFSTRTERRAMEEDVHNGGRLELTFMRALCTPSRVEWKSTGQGVFLSGATLIENMPARSEVLEEDRCAVVLDVCAVGDHIVEPGDGMLTVWVPVKNTVKDCVRAQPLRRQSSPRL